MKTLFLKPNLGSKNKNIVRDFVYGCWCNGKRIGGMQMPPINDLYSLTHARNAGIETVFIDAQSTPDQFEALKSNRFQGINAVVTMTSTQSFVRDIEVFTEIKNINPDTKTILFGSHPTFMPEYCLEPASVDFLVRREPEETLRQLLTALKDKRPTDGLAGIAYRDETGRPVINPDRPFMDLDDLPIPDRTVLPKSIDYFNPVVKQLPYTTMQTSRGCPGRCIFCTAPVFYGNKYRSRSKDRILEEFLEIQRLGYREIFIRDETFTANRKRNRAVFEELIRLNTGITWIANGRVDMIDFETMKMMKAAGCHMIKFGVETSSDELLKKYKKDTTREQAVQAFADARRAGLETHAHLVFGGPGETLKTIDDTIEFVKGLKPTTASFGILTPYPGTPLFDTVAATHPAIRDGSSSNMENLHVKGFYSEAVCGLSGEILSQRIVKAYRSFYLRPSYLFSRLVSIRSLSQLMILIVAGLNVIGFALSGKK